MALDLGELVGTIRLDIVPFNLSASQAELRAAEMARNVNDEVDSVKGGTVEVKAKADTSDLKQGKKDLDDFKTSAKGDLLEIGTSVGGLLTKAGAAGPAILAVGSALSAMAAGAVGVVSAVGPAAVGGLAVFTGGMVAIKTASMAVSFATQNVSAAVNGSQTAFDKLTPSGQAYVRQLQALKPELDSIRSRVQDGLFPGLETSISLLSKDYLPTLQNAASQTGNTLGGLAVDAAKMAETPAFRASFGDIVAGNTKTLDSMGHAGINLADAAVTLFGSAQPLIKVFFDWAEGVSAGLADTVRAADESGRLADFWQVASDRGAVLGDILGNVGGALGDVFHIGAADGAGGQMLLTLRDTTAELEKWTSSEAGAKSIAGWFERGQENLGAMWGLLKSVGGGLSDIGSGQQLAPLIDQITKEVIPPLMEFLGNASVSGALGSLVTAVGDLLGVFAKLSANDQSLVSFSATLGALATAAGWIIDNVPGANAALGIMFTLIGGVGALKFVGLGSLVSGILSIGGAALTAGAEMVVGWAMGQAAADASKLAQIRAVAAMVGGWVLMGAQALLGAAKIAASWIIAMGPIALVIAAVVGVGILIYKNWDQIKVWTGDAWDWVVDKVKKVPGLIIGFFMNFTLPGLIIGHWQQIKDGVAEKGGQMLDWVKALPGKVLNQFMGSGVLLKEKGKDLLQGLKDGASDKWDAIRDWVAMVPVRFLNTVGAVGNTLKDKGRELLQGLRDGAGEKWDAIVGWVQATPERFMNNVGFVANTLKDKGRDLLQGLRDGAEEKWTALTTWVGTLGTKAVTAVGNLGSILKNAGLAIIQGLLDGITEKFETVKNKISDITSWIGSHKGPKSVDLMLWRGPGNWIVQGLMDGLDDQMPNLERKVGDVTDRIADAPMPSMMASVPVPASAEVSAYATSRAGAANGARGGDTYQIYETTNPQATAAEVSRRQSFAGAGA